MVLFVSRLKNTLLQSHILGSQQSTCPKSMCFNYQPATLLLSRKRRHPCDVVISQNSLNCTLYQVLHWRHARLGLGFNTRTREQHLWYLMIPSSNPWNAHHLMLRWSHGQMLTVNERHHYKTIKSLLSNKGLGTLSFRMMKAVATREKVKPHPILPHLRNSRSLRNRNLLTHLPASDNRVVKCKSLLVD